MSIGPVGLQVIMRSATAAKKSDNSDVEKSEVLNRQFQQKFQKEVHEIHSKVVKNNEVEKLKDKKEKDKNKKNDKNDKKKKEKTNNSSGIIDSVSIYDRQI